MAENSAIEWTHHTVNFWWGCEKVSPACAHCYAEGQAARFYPGLWGADGERRIRLEAARREAFRYERQAIREGRRLRVFTNSMADFFEDRRDLDEVRAEALAVILDTPHLDWLILTKRPERIPALLRRAATHPRLATRIPAWVDGILPPPANVWLGTTVEDQERADQRLPHLLRAPAAVRFVSVEPLLGPVNLCGIGLHKGWCPTHDFPGGFCHGPCPDDRRLDWVICGGESGRQARPMHPDWARSLRDQCAAAGVPFLFKQWGEWAPFVNEDHYTHGGAERQAHAWVEVSGKLDGLCWIVDDDGTWSNYTGKPPLDSENELPRTVAIMGRHGKKAAGRLLDGQLHDAYPEVARG